MAESKKYHTPTVEESLPLLEDLSVSPTPKTLRVAEVTAPAPAPAPAPAAPDPATTSSPLPTPPPQASISKPHPGTSWNGFWKPLWFSLEPQDKKIVTTASVGLLVALLILFLVDPGGIFKGGREVAKVETKGSVRHRFSGNLHWVSQSGNLPIYVKDILFIPNGTHAELTYNGNKILLPQDTMIQFDETTLDEIEVMLHEEKRPPVIPLPLRLKKFASLISDVAGFELRFGELRDRTKGHLFGALTLAPLKPLAPVPELSSHELTKVVLRVLSPKKGEQLDMKTGGWIKFTWTELPNKKVAYRVEVSRDSNFAKVIRQDAKGTSMMMRLSESGKYFLRVSGILEGKVVASQLSHFELVKSLAGAKK